MARRAGSGMARTIMSALVAPAGMVMGLAVTALTGPATLNRDSVAASAMRSSSTVRVTSSPAVALKAVAAKEAVTGSETAMAKARVPPVTVTGAPSGVAAATVTLKFSTPSCSSSSAMGMRKLALAAPAAMRKGPPRMPPPISPGSMGEVAPGAMVQVTMRPVEAPLMVRFTTAAPPSLTVPSPDTATVALSGSEAAMAAAKGAASLVPPSKARSFRLMAMAKLSAPSAMLSSAAVMVKEVAGKMTSPVTAAKSAAVVPPWTMRQVMVRRSPDGVTVSLNPLLAFRV